MREYRSVHDRVRVFLSDAASVLARGKASQPRLWRKSTGRTYTRLSLLCARARARPVRSTESDDIGLFYETVPAVVTRHALGGKASVLCRALCPLVCNLFSAFRVASARPSRILLSFAHRDPLLCVRRCFLRRGPVSAEGTKGDCEGGQRRPGQGQEGESVRRPAHTHTHSRRIDRELVPLDVSR